jgi:hypothetical protein
LIQASQFLLPSGQEYFPVEPKRQGILSGTIFENSQFSLSLTILHKLHYHNSLYARIAYVIKICTNRYTADF